MASLSHRLLVAKAVPLLQGGRPTVSSQGLTPRASCFC